MHRTMTLGWTPQLFGRFDRYLNYHDASRNSHKSERFGKKYQWIAYHELLGRVADNFHFASPYEDEPGEFHGIHQFNDREVDPSLPPVPYREFQERKSVKGRGRRYPWSSQTSFPVRSTFKVMQAISKRSLATRRHCQTPRGSCALKTSMAIRGSVCSVRDRDTSRG